LLILRPDPFLGYLNAPLDVLLAILLRQYRRPLASHDIHLTDAEADALAHDLAARAPLTGKALAIRAALVDLIAESMGVLARWNLTFAQSLDADMTDIPGWESTADFLDIANEKANAELRVSTGAALLTALGDPRHTPELLALVERGEHDLDAVIARRVLLLASGVAPDDPAWLDTLRAWVAAH
jgi:hypothetical protein